MSSEQIISQTKYWINSFIIKFNICPFAPQVFIQDKIYYKIINSTLLEKCLYAVFSESQHLDKHSDIETTFLIFPNIFHQFDEFLNFLELSEELLKLHNYEGVYQLASFHPGYCFKGEAKQDPANYTNRSPYPMLHLIRESSISKALKSFPQAELIPKNNIALTRKLGAKRLQIILNIAQNK